MCSKQTPRMFQCYFEYGVHEIFAKHWQFLLIWRSFLWKPTLCTLPLSKQYPRKSASFLFLFSFHHALHLVKHLLMELIYTFVFFVARDHFLVYFTLVKHNIISTGHIVWSIQLKTTSLCHTILVCTCHGSCFFRLSLLTLELVLESTSAISISSFNPVAKFETNCVFICLRYFGTLQTLYFTNFHCAFI